MIKKEATAIPCPQKNPDKPRIYPAGRHIPKSRGPSESAALYLPQYVPVASCIHEHLLSTGTVYTMQHMTLRPSFILLLSFCFSACARNSTQAAAGKADYIATLENLSYSAMQQKLKSDIAQLDKLADSTRGITLSLSFSISGGNERSGAADTAAHFQLPAAAMIREEFGGLQNGMEAEQQFMLPGSGFEFSPGNRLEVIDGDNVHYTIAKVYTGGRELAPEALKLKRADSLQLRAAYQYPTAYDTLVIRSTDKDSVRYGSFNILIDELKENEVSLSLPLALNSKLIGYQALSKEGILMNASSHSSMPVTGVSAGVLNEIKTMREQLRHALAQGSKEAVLAAVNSIPEHAFTSRNRLEQLFGDIDKIGKAEAKDLSFKEIARLVRQFRDNYKDILGPKAQSLELKFPAGVAQVYLFAGTRYDSLSQSITAVNTAPKGENEVFRDQATNKYGIIDAASNILIPAQYEGLTKQNPLYFVERVDAQEFTYFLNTAARKLEKIDGGKKIVAQLNKDLAVFSDKDNYEGVLRNNKEEVVPFRYEHISITGGVLVAEGSKRGRSFFEFYTIAGKQITTGPVKEAKNIAGNSNIILMAPDKKFGLMNGRGEVSIAPAYERIEFLSDNHSSMIIYTRAQPNGDALYGIIGADGKTVSPATFEYIGDLQEGLATFRPATGNDDKRYGFINLQGQVVIPAKFDKVGDFIQGMALAAFNNKLGLIDKKGNTIVTFPGNAGDAEVRVLGEEARSRGACYEINGKTYNAKGEPVKK